MVHGTHNAIQDDRNNHIKIYVNGEFFNRKDAKISVFDSGYLVGDESTKVEKLTADDKTYINEQISVMISNKYNFIF